MENANHLPHKLQIGHINQSLLTRKRFVIGAIITISVLLRVGAAFFLGDQVEPLSGAADQLSYHNLALRVLGGHGFTFEKDWWPATPAGADTAHWSYLYTLYLVLVYWLFGPHPLIARLIQAAIVGILHPYIVYLLCRRIFGILTGIVTAGLTAVYGYFIFYSATLMTEPMYITAILASLYLAIRLVDTLKAKQPDRQRIQLALFLGLTLGAATLLRQLFMLLVPFFLLWIWWAGRRNADTSLVRLLALSGFIIALMILPFTAFNYGRFGRFVLLNTNAGFAFFWGNHPIYGTQFIPILPDYKSLLPVELLHLDEAALDRSLLVRGIQFVLEDPVRYIRLSLSRIPIYFTFWPTTESGLINNLSRVLSFGFALPFMVYGLVRAWALPDFRRPTWLSSPLTLFTTFAIVYSGIHFLTWTLIRYRLPVDAVLLMFAGLGIVDITRRLTERQNQAPQST